MIHQLSIASPNLPQWPDLQSIFSVLVTEEAKIVKFSFLPLFIVFFHCWSPIHIPLQFPLTFSYWNSLKRGVWKPPCLAFGGRLPLHLTCKKVLCAALVRDIQHQLSLGSKAEWSVYSSGTCVLPYKQHSTQRASYHTSHGHRYVFHIWLTFFVFESPRATH